MADVQQMLSANVGQTVPQQERAVAQMPPAKEEGSQLRSLEVGVEVEA